MPRKQPAAKAAPPPEETAPAEESSGTDEFTEEGQSNAEANETPAARRERKKAEREAKKAATNQADDATADASGEGDDPADDAEPDTQLGTSESPAEEPTENAEAPVSEEAVTAKDEAKGNGSKTRATRRKKPDSSGEEAAADGEKRSAPAPALAKTASLDDTDDYLKILWYGIGGTTKTTSLLDILNIGDPGKLLVINAEAGLKARALRDRGIDTSRVQLWPDPSTGEQITYDGLVSVYNKLEKDLREDPDSWCGVGMDSTTEVLQLLLDNIRKKLYQEQQEKLARSTSGRIGPLRGRFETDTDDYTEVNNMLRQVLRDIRYLPCHFGMTALERSDDNKETGRRQFGPAVSPSFQGSLLGYVDIAIRTAGFTQEDGSDVFTGRTRPSQHEQAKDRYGVLPVNMVDPTASRIAKYILGELTEEADELQNREEAEDALAQTERRASTGRQLPAKKSRRSAKKDDEATEAESEETELAAAAS